MNVRSRLEHSAITVEKTTRHHVSVRMQRFADQQFGDVRSVDIVRVNEVDAQLTCAVQRAQHF